MSAIKHKNNKHHSRFFPQKSPSANRQPRRGSAIFNFNTFAIENRKQAYLLHAGFTQEIDR